MLPEPKHLDWVNAVVQTNSITVQFATAIQRGPKAGAVVPRRWTIGPIQPLNRSTDYRALVSKEEAEGMQQLVFELDWVWDLGPEVKD